MEIRQGKYDGARGFFQRRRCRLDRKADLMRSVMHGYSPVIRPLHERLAEGRPVLSRTAIAQLIQRLMAMTTADTVAMYVTHTARFITRIANDQVLTSDDGDELEISISTQYGGRGSVWVLTNQVTEGTLRAIVERCEALARDQLGGESLMTERQEQDDYLPVALWYDTTIQAMTTARDTIAHTIIAGVTRHGLRAAGSVGIMARAKSILTKEGIYAFGEETDCEVTVTARGMDGKSSGWAGQAARDWSTIDVAKVAEDAAQMALMGKGPQAVEPGRRTAILGPAAVVQMMRFFAQELDAWATDYGQTGFSKPGGGNRLGQRVFDPRVQMESDPADKDGGYFNYFYLGLANPKMMWVENGVLVNMAYNLAHAMTKGKPYAEDPYSLRMAGGPSSIPKMIAACKEGIYVNRLSSVELIDKRTGLMTGVTRDGCFLIKNGKIDRPVKNFRILESPFFFLNKLIDLGTTARAPFGYTPLAAHESIRDQSTWPRRPMIVPPLMVQDFNFSALADVV
jgi:predicted Zn-dependent protease